MNERGFMIDQEGKMTSFGSYNDKVTLDIGHKKSFEQDIVDTPYFQSLGLEYDSSQTFYANAERLSRQGLLFVFDHQLDVFSPTQIAAYMPTNPTQKQIQSLQQLQPKLDQIKIKKLYELHSKDYRNAEEYSSFQDYIESKNKMVEQGIIIFENGVTMSFGKYYCPNEPEYAITPNHEESFHCEIEQSTEFKLSKYIYHDNLDFYPNLLKFSLEGMIIIINNQKSTTSKTEVMSYVPSNPTEEQLNSLRENKMLEKIEIQKIYEFGSFDFDDYLEYEGFQDYINSKSIQKS